MQNKSERFVRTVFTPRHHTELRLEKRLLANAELELKKLWTKQDLTDGTARLVCGGKDSKQTHQKKGCIPWERERKKKGFS